MTAGDNGRGAEEWSRGGEILFLPKHDTSCVSKVENKRIVSSSTYCLAQHHVPRRYESGPRRVHLHVMLVKYLQLLHYLSTTAARIGATGFSPSCLSLMQDGAEGI